MLKVPALSAGRSADGSFCWALEGRRSESPMVRLLSLFDTRATFGVSKSLKGKHTRMAVNDRGGHRGRFSDDEPAKQEVNRERR